MGDDQAGSPQLIHGSQHLGAGPLSLVRTIQPAASYPHDSTQLASDVDRLIDRIADPIAVFSSPVLVDIAYMTSGIRLVGALAAFGAIAEP